MGFFDFFKNQENIINNTQIHVEESCQGIKMDNSIIIDENVIKCVLYIEAFGTDGIKKGKFYYQGDPLIRQIDGMINIARFLFNKKDISFLDIKYDLSDDFNNVIKENLGGGELHNKKDFISNLFLSLDILRIKYEREDESTYINELVEFTSGSFADIKIILEALMLYYSLNKCDITYIVENNQEIYKQYVSEKEDIIKKNEEEYLRLKKLCDIEKEKQKILKRSEKKQLREKAKKQLEFHGKLESREMYGEILYKGEMYTIQSREDIECFLEIIKK